MTQITRAWSDYDTDFGCDYDDGLMIRGFEKMPLLCKVPANVKIDHYRLVVCPVNTNAVQQIFFTYEETVPYATDYGLVYQDIVEANSYRDEDPPIESWTSFIFAVDSDNKFYKLLEIETKIPTEDIGEGHPHFR